METTFFTIREFDAVSVFKTELENFFGYIVCVCAPSEKKKERELELS